MAAAIRQPDSLAPEELLNAAATQQASTTSPCRILTRRT
jgi:hypothetical protein